MLNRLTSHVGLLRRAVFVFALFLNACVTYPVQVTIHSNSILNPDEKNRSLPVMIKFYQLNNRQVFTDATFRDLWLSPREALGSALQKEMTIVIGPGEKKSFRFDHNGQVRYLAAVAIFRKPTGDRWRTIKQIGQDLPILIDRISVNVMNRHITMH